MHHRFLAAALLWAGLACSSSLLAATFTVNSILDTGDTNPGDNVCEATSGGIQCTLRAAIEEANAWAGNDVIEFSIAGLTVINISGTPLPTIVDRLTIDGSSAPSYSAGASNAADAPPAVYINGIGLAGSTADGFRIANGLSLSRIIAIGIIGFPDNGIEVVNTDNVVIDSNWIGVSFTGGVSPNGGSGVYLNDCNNCVVGQTINQVGPALVGRGNVINNNLEDGVFVILGDNSIIAGNAIGLDSFTDSDQGNAGHGIHLQGPNVRVGDTLNGLSAPNYITNNNGSGLRAITGGHRIYSNWFWRNGTDGVVLNGSGTRLGFATADQGNRIFQNTGSGVVIGSVLASSSNEVKRNVIFGNSLRGVRVIAGSSNEISNNEVYGNADDGIRIDSASNIVSSNTIGLSFGAVNGNGSNGISLLGDANTVNGNQVHGSADDGIDIVSGSGNIISDNNIGTGSTGQDYGNNGNGVRVRAAATTTSITNNRIGHNSFDGLLLEGGGSTLCGNRIGFGVNYEAAGNAVEGVRIIGGGNRVGGTDVACSENYIGNNGSDGLQIEGDANIVRDNLIGRSPSVLAGNGNGGVLLTNGAALNEIIGNVFQDNGTDAVRVSATAGTRNRIQENDFFLNGETAGDLAIDINLDGKTPNDPADPDSGANNVQNTPELVSVVESPGQLTITYRINSSTSNSTYPITVDFYRGSYALGGAKAVEGVFVFRDIYNVTPNTNKIVQFDPNPASENEFGTIQAMATDAEGNSSEFSAEVSFDISAQEELIFMDGFEDP